MTLWIPSRTARLLGVAGAAAVLALSGAPSAVADSTNRVGVCSSQVVAGVEVDNCVPNPNPNPNTIGEVPGVNVELEGGLGLGIGG